MKRHLIAILLGIAAGALSIPLALLPNAFNSIQSGNFNKNLHLTWFLGNALQGLLASALLITFWQRVRPSTSVSRVLLGWAVTALFGVLIPAPGILYGKYADGLIGWYAVSVAFAATIFFSSFSRTKRDQ